jgi:hypothetical protein
MPEPETAPVETVDSPETPVSGDTAVDTSHTSEPEDLDSLIERVKARADEIPAEKLSFLDRKFQSAFTTRVNRLNNSVGNVARTVAETVKAELPPDIDIFSTEGQKAFADAILKAQGEQLKPVLAHNEAQRGQQLLAANLEIAKRDSPIVAEHLKDIAPIYDSSPDLQVLGMQQDYAALPLVLEGIGYKVAYDKVKTELAQVKKLMEASSTAAKTGKSTSRAGGHAPGGERAGKLKLADAIKEAEKQLGQGT